MGLAGREATWVSAVLSNSLHGLEENQSWPENPTREYKLKPIMPLKINCQDEEINPSITGLNEKVLK